MDAVTKVAKQRRSVLQLAEKLGNAAEACRKRRVDRTTFYEWKRRFQTQGFEGLKDLPPIHRSHLQTTAPEVVERIKALALEHPAYGCNRIEPMVALGGRRVSAITVQKTLNDHGLGSRYDRWLALEEANAGKTIEITSERAAFIETLNPCFKERHVESASPGEFICADTFLVGTRKGIGKVYLTPWSTATRPMPSASCTSRSSLNDFLLVPGRRQCSLRREPPPQGQWVGRNAVPPRHQAHRDPTLMRLGNDRQPLCRRPAPPAFWALAKPHSWECDQS